MRCDCNNRHHSVRLNIEKGVVGTSTPKSTKASPTSWHAHTNVSLELLNCFFVRLPWMTAKIFICRKPLKSRRTGHKSHEVNALQLCSKCHFRQHLTGEACICDANGEEKTRTEMKNKPTENVCPTQTRTPAQKDKEKRDHKMNRKCWINLLIWITFPICVLQHRRRRRWQRRQTK